MSRSPRRYGMARSVGMLAIMIAAAAAPVRAQNLNRFFDAASSGSTWDSTSTANWASASGGPYNIVFGGSYNRAIFEGTAGTVNIAASVSVNAFTFNTTGYTITGGTISKGSPSGGTYFFAGSGVTGTINSNITTTTAGIQKYGLGTVQLGGNVTYGTGTTNADYWLKVDAGTLRITAGTHASPTFLVLGNDSADANAQTFAQTGGTFTQSNSIYLGNASGSGASTFDLSGGTFMQTAGSVAFANRNSATINISNTADVTFAAVTAGANASNAQAATLNLDGGSLTAPSFTKAATNATFAFNFNGGTLHASASSATYISALNRLNVRNGGAIIDTAAFNDTIVNALDHSNIGGDAITDGGLTKRGSGTLTLSNNNTYTGATTVSNGLLNVTGSLANNGSDKIFIAADANGDFSSGTDTKLARAVAAAASYAGYGSAINSSLMSEADLLGGTNTTGSTKTLAMQWRTLASTAGEINASDLASDVLNLTGIDTTKFVLQMSYDPIDGEAAAAAAGHIYLAWLNTNTDTWLNAIAGNHGSNVGSTNILGSWAGAGGSTLALGSWGVDTTNHVVWAVLDHNSQFAVVAVPTPLALPAGLLLLTLAPSRRR